MSVKIPGKCECGGDIVADAHAFSCLSCGKEWVKSAELRAFYQEYRESIAVDLRTNGDQWVIENWGIKKRSLSQLKKAWDHLSPTEPEPEPVVVANVALPAFPAFSNYWDVSVQIKWLEIWLYLKTLKKEEVINAIKDN